MIASYSRLTTVVVLGSAVVVASLLALRIYHSISFVEPLLSQTSGAEQESLFAVWKAIKGLPVYADPLAIPYAHSSFNWLFYAMYGGIAGWVLAAFHLADEWVPTIGRLITFAGVGIGVIVSWLSFRAAIPRPRPEWFDGLAGAFALLVFAGPLTGFWAITVRPDVWATVLEVAAVGLFVAHWNKAPLRAVVLVLVFGYLAWSFKTISIIGPACVGLFLLIKRRWGLAVLLGAGTVLLWLATLAIGGEVYRFSLVGIVTNVGFELAVGFGNFGRFAAKAVPPLAVLAVLALMEIRDGRLRRAMAADEIVQFVFLAAGAGFTAALLGGFQAAAGDNYYFTPLFLLSLAALVGFARTMAQPEVPRLPLLAGIAGGWLVQAALVIVVLAGIHGVVSMSHHHEGIAKIRPCLRALPTPAYIDHTVLALPWIAPGEPYFVLTFYYDWLRSNGFAFERGGIGGLIREGYFGSLAFQEPRDNHDGAPLDGYERAGRSCADWIVYLKREEKKGPGG